MNDVYVVLILLPLSMDWLSMDWSVKWELGGGRGGC